MTEAPPATPDDIRHEGISGLDRLLQPSGGLFSALSSFTSEDGEPRYTTTIARSGNLSRLWRDLRTEVPPRHSKAVLSGSGTGIDPAGTAITALAEGLERYCTTMFHEGQFLSATANHLGDAAIDLDSIPRCSEKELADPRCPLVRPSKSETIRWVKGVCLFTSTIRWIPAALVYLFMKPSSAAERLSIQITTGCGAHRDYERALLAGLLEVMERDAISLTWLQRMPLRRIEITAIPPALTSSWDRYLHSSKHLEAFFFDATTDTGVPIVYALQRSSTDPRLCTIACCAAALNPVEAIAKVMKDMVSVRRYLRHPAAVPEQWKDFSDLAHGASFMAKAEQAHAFDFLTETQRTVRLDDLPSIDAPTSSHALRTLLNGLRKKEMEAFAVDLTTDEALRAGMRVVRVVIPALQPFSFHYRARYLGHKRLYQAPQAMGYPVHAENDLNPWPQPFA